ncbi:hypothetical protein RYX36_030684 [Vicia faba]
MEKKLEPEVTDGVCKAVVPLPELLASRIEAELFILPFKPPSSHLSCSLPLRFTRTICTLQHLQHKQPQTSRTVIGILEERGLLDSITNDALRSISSNTINAPLKAYCGFDPTAENLHLGNLLGLIVLSCFRRSGHNVVAMIGGATARVDDPSGKSLERPELDVETLEGNTAGIENTIKTILVVLKILTSKIRM